jgi:Ni,Fe-hydrogenase maturation factor
MAIQFKRSRAVLLDVVAVEEAEGLLDWLQKTKAAKVDLSGLTHLHTANLQVLMAAKPEICGWPEDIELRAWLEAALKSRE